MAGLQQLAEGLLLEISPRVAIEPLPPRGNWAGVSGCGPEMLLVDITGIGDWFGDEPAVLRAAQQFLAGCGLSARMAVADNPAAAWALARFGAAANVLVAPGQTVDAVWPLPVRALRLAEPVAHQLDRLGVATIGQLCRLPRGGLASRLGSQLLGRIDEITGVLRRPLVMHQSLPEDEAVCQLEYPTADAAILGHRIGLLIDEVSSRLAARERGALRLICRLQLCEDHPPRQVEIGLFTPTVDAKHLHQLTLMALQSQPLAANAHRLIVTIELSGPLREHQQRLFEDQPTGGARRALGRLVETVATRLGSDAVLGVALTEQPRPEAAYRLYPLAGMPQQAKRQRLDGRQHPLATGTLKSPRRTTLTASSGPRRSDPLRRPLLLHHRPHRVDVEVSPTARMPLVVRVEHDDVPGCCRTHRVLHCWGPERIDMRDVDQRPERRDYYRVETEDGQWFWLFHRSRPGEQPTWYWHGQFD